MVRDALRRFSAPSAAQAAGLVSVKVEGTRRLYQVDADGLAGLRAELDRFWSRTLAAHKVAVEQPTEASQ